MALQADVQRAHWGGIYAMTLCVFVLIASEFMPVSLLSPIAADLGVTEGLAGQGIAISGALAVITSLTLSRLTAGLDRRYLLLGMTALMAFSAAMIAMAANYGVYMVGRALIGIAIGGFWSMSAATAIRLVPESQVPRALAIFNGGNALATVIAAPLGSYLGDVMGWRGAFFCLVPVAIAAFIWQWFSLPAMHYSQQRSRVLPLFACPVVAVGLLACGLFFMGQFTLFTYVRPFLEGITQVRGTALSAVLLIIGVMGFIGTLVVGRLLKHGIYRTLILIPLLMAAIAIALMIFGDQLWFVVPLLGAWGLVATAAPTGWWTWLARTLPHDAEVGGGVMVAIIQLSIALGSTLGGLMYDHHGWHSTFALSAGVLLCASIITFTTSRKHTLRS